MFRQKTVWDQKISSRRCGCIFIKHFYTYCEDIVCLGVSQCLLRFAMSWHRSTVNHERILLTRITFFLVLRRRSNKTLCRIVWHIRDYGRQKWVTEQNQWFHSFKGTYPVLVKIRDCTCVSGETNKNWVLHVRDADEINEIRMTDAQYSYPMYCTRTCISDAWGCLTIPF